MKLTKTDYGVICHELGHCLIGYLIGKKEQIERIEFNFTLYESNGCVVWKLFRWGADGIPTAVQWTDEDKLLILYGGVSACRVTDRPGTRISGTDKEQVFSISTPEERRKAESRAISMLTPFKELLNAMTDEIAEIVSQSSEEVNWITADMLWGLIPDKELQAVRECYGTPGI